jgi:hypothetical protein
MRYVVSSITLALILALILGLAAPLASGQTIVDRGRYYRNTEHGFSLWIPKGFYTAKADKHEIACFSGPGPGGYHIVFETTRYASLAVFLKATRSAHEDQFKGMEMEVFEDLKAAGRPAVMIWIRKLEADKDFKNREMVSAGVELPEGDFLNIDLYLEKGSDKQALQRMRGMLATLRWTGEDGLNPYLQSRILDLHSGLSYRLPNGFAPAPPQKGEVMAAGNEKERTRINLARAEASNPDEALSAALSGHRLRDQSWRFPHPEEIPARGGVIEPRGKGVPPIIRVAVAFQPPKAPVYLLTALGSNDQAESLVRAVELMLMSIRYQDVEAARRETTAATGALEAAIQRKDDSAALREVGTLARYTFLAEARAALAMALDRSRDPAVLAAAATALGEAGEQDAFDALYKAARNPRNQKDEKLCTALVKALGRVRGAQAVSVLVKLFRRQPNTVVVEVIRSLGRYTDEKPRALKELVRQMEKDEKAARKTDIDARERWIVVKPAYQAALKNLTGQHFENAEQAETWVRENR